MLKQRSPARGPRTGTGPAGSFRSWTAQQEVSLNVMCLNHPETIPHTLVRGKIVMKPVPAAKKAVGHSVKGQEPGKIRVYLESVENLSMARAIDRDISLEM